MVLHERALHRVQVVNVGRKTLDRDQFLAVDGRQELDAGIDGSERQIIAVRFSDDDSAGAAVAFGTALFRSLATEVFAQELQDRSGRVCVVDLDDFAVEHKPDGGIGHRS